MNKLNSKKEHAEMTKEALLQRAEQLFAGFGYAKTSIDEIVRQEQLTKGAYYYHFKDKQAIFEQVVDRHLQRMVDSVASSISGLVDPWERAITAVETYFEGCMQPVYRKLVLQEAPVVLGWDSWREKEKQSVMGLSAMLLQELMDAGKIQQQPLAMLSYLIFGAITEAALGIAESANPDEARAQAKLIVEKILRSF